MAKYKAYPEYKDSGVEWLGEIPEDWSVTKLKYIADLQTAKSNNSDELFVGLENISSGDGKYISKEESIADGTSVSFEKNDVLFGKLRPYLAKSWLATFSGVCSSEFLVLRTAKLHPKYLNYYSLTNEFIEQVNSSTYGSKMPRASWEFIGLLPVPTCSYFLSERVAWFLDHETAKIDNLIEKQQQLIELLKEKRQAVISHAVTKGLNPDVPMKDSGVEWLGEVPEHWSIQKLKYICTTIVAGPFGSSITKDMYVNDGYKVYGQEQVIPNDFNVGDYFISADDFKKLSRYEVKNGDMLISCVGTFGKIAVFPDWASRGIINPRLIKVSLINEVNPLFVREFLKSETVFKQFELLSRGGTMGVINIAILNEIMTSTPPFAEQNAIVEFIYSQKKKFKELIEKAYNQIGLLQERRTALISAAVTGKIDVRDWVAPDTQKTEETAA
ncbi:restriction endonuclease subunit S [Morganella morganii]|nr:restriction endonuclease subunit S [Morganella morganii]EKW7747709.1 restriction endonuclease subunit S [Morganella morganii]HCR3201306.1 restriction endonuclease subunit S [Morganella morganii]HCT8187544.1 restriction endonuclease subunit S [Morganella morganii]